MKKLLLPITAFLLVANAASAQTSGYYGRANNPGGTDQNNTNASTFNVVTQGIPSTPAANPYNGADEITGPNSNRIDPSAQLKLVTTSSSIQLNNGGPAVAYSTGIQPRQIITSSQSSSTAFGANGHTVFSQDRTGNSSASYNVSNEAQHQAGQFGTPYSTNLPPSSSAHASNTYQADDAYRAAGADVKIAVRDVSISQRYVADSRNAVARRSSVAMSLYPNPARSYTNVLFNEPARQKVSVYVVDLNGQIQQSYSFDPGGNNFYIDVSTLPIGVYSVQVQEQGRAMYDLKLSRTN